MHPHPAARNLGEGIHVTLVEDTPLKGGRPAASVNLFPSKVLSITDLGSDGKRIVLFHGNK